ncbi:hypothetical protein DL98DRAFT_13892 [Cadophora sp. DSE1049]|nr:hypothetical protein DL98DRAFT_13892 [Cadophora sp. DSE1049]
MFNLLQLASQHLLQLKRYDCFTVGYTLDKYHHKTGDPICLFESFFLQLYPVGPGSLPLEPGCKGSANNLLYKVTFSIADNQIHVLQGLLIGRLMKNREATSYVVFLASDHRLYACFHSAVDRYEVGPYRYEDDDDDYDYSDEEETADPADPNKVYLRSEAVFGRAAVLAVDFGTLDDMINENCTYKIMDQVTSWNCYGYDKGTSDPTFAADTILAEKHILAKNLKSSPTHSDKSPSTTPSGSSEHTISDSISK